MINKEMIEEAAYKLYPDNGRAVITSVVGRRAFESGAQFAIEQMSNDAVKLLDWIAENGWYTSDPMWCNGERASDCDGGKSTHVELTSQELYQLYLDRVR